MLSDLLFQQTRKQVIVYWLIKIWANIKKNTWRIQRKVLERFFKHLYDFPTNQLTSLTFNCFHLKNGERPALESCDEQLSSDNYVLVYTSHSVQL